MPKMPEEVFQIFLKMIGKPSYSSEEKQRIRHSARNSLIRTPVVLSPDERGLVINVPVERMESGAFRYGKHLDPQLVRFALLFWDRIDVPQNNHKRIPLSQEEGDLAKAGILVRTQHKFRGNWTTKDVLLDAPLSAYRQHEVHEPGQWSLAQNATFLEKPSKVWIARDLSLTNFLMSDEEGIPDRAFLFELHRAVLVPDVSVPLHEVLEFRERRRDELIALRHHLEAIYADVLSSPDRPLRERHELEKLDKALSDHLKSARESRFPFVLSSLQAKFDAQALGVGVATAAAASTAGLPFAAAALVGAGSALVASLSVTAGLKGGTKTSNPFAYIGKFHRELY